MSRKRIILFSLGIGLALLAAFLWMSCRNQPPQCPLCERDIHEHMGVSITHNGLPMKTCCMSCALTFQMQESNVTIKAATDFETSEALDPHKAIYVVGSDISPCTQDVKVQKTLREPHEMLFACYDRCEPGILAFRTKSHAMQFQSEHGGHLVEQFEQLKNWLPAGGHKHD